MKYFLLIAGFLLVAGISHPAIAAIVGIACIAVSVVRHVTGRS